MNSLDINILAIYNAEVGRGIVHTPEWKSYMQSLQTRFDIERTNKLIAEGYKIIPGRRE